MWKLYKNMCRSRTSRKYTRLYKNMVIKSGLKSGKNPISVFEIRVAPYRVIIDLATQSSICGGRKYSF